MQGNTLQESFEDLSIDISRYTNNFKKQKNSRIQQNKKSAYKVYF